MIFKYYTILKNKFVNILQVWFNVFVNKQMANSTLLFFIFNVKIEYNKLLLYMPTPTLS